MEMFTVLKDSSISPKSSSSSSSSSIFSGCKRKSISQTTKATPQKQPQIVPDLEKDNDTDEEIKNKKLKTSNTTTTTTTSSVKDSFKIYKEIQEKHIKEWDWKSASQVHYSNDVHSKFLGSTKQNKTKSQTNKSSTSASSNLEQTVIDAGQKNVGQMVCSKCKMLYSYGSKEDEAAHQSFCNGNIQQQKVIIKNWKSMKILTAFPNGQSIIVVSRDNISGNPTLSSKINQIKEIVNSELGYGSKSNVNNNNNNNEDDDDDNDEKVFLYLDSNGRVLGCLIAERVDKGYKIETSTPTIQCSKTPSKILCGINRIWVLPNSRKRGIASKLMESLASNMYYCYHLKKHEIATTQPSTSGLQFFTNYFQTNQFLLYNINK